MVVYLKIKNYEINLEQAVIKINKKGYKKVLLQIPEGLKNYFSNFVEYIEKNTKTSVFISGDPCFGACDVYDYGLDSLLHSRHNITALKSTRCWEQKGIRIGCFDVL